MQIAKMKITALTFSLFGFYHSTVFAAAPPISPGFFAVEQKNLTCKLDPAPPIDERLKAHPFYKGHLKSDWIVPKPNAHWFRDVAPGDTATRVIKLQNISKSEKLTLTSIRGLTEDFSHNATFPLDIPPGSQKTIEFTYSPLFASEPMLGIEGSFHFAQGGQQDFYLWGENNSSKSVENVTDCGILDQPNTVYVLQNDVSTNDGTPTDSCFSIRADQITLDLNGHTITYGKHGQDLQHAIVTAATSSFQAQPGFSGGSIEGLHITNGTIEQTGYHDSSITPGLYSHAIFLNEQPNSQNIEISNLTIRVHGNSAQAIRARQKHGLNIHHNTIESKVTEIVNRHQMDGAQIYAGKSTYGRFVSIHDNTLSNSVQGSILSNTEHSQIFNNYVSHHGAYTNDFGIYAWSKNGAVFDNTIAPTSGRGIQLNSTGTRVFDNTVNVIGLSNNAEYAGCQGGGTYGIQLEEKTKESLVINNDITATAGICGAVGIRLTSILPDGKNIVAFNKVDAKNITGDGYPIAVSLGTIKPNSVITYRNDLKTDGMGYQIDFSGATGGEFIQDTLNMGSNPSTPGAWVNDLWALFIYNGMPVSNLSFEDVDFGDIGRDLIMQYAEQTWHSSVSYSFKNSYGVKLETPSDSKNKVKFSRSEKSAQMQSVDKLHVVTSTIEKNTNSADRDRITQRLSDNFEAKVILPNVIKSFSLESNDSYQSYNCIQPK